MTMGMALMIAFQACSILAVIFLCAFACKLQRDKDGYKTGIWLAAGKAQRGEPAKDIIGALECYLPDEDKRQFKELFMKDIKPQRVKTDTL
jgi:hypothetical protein